jgi:hypothetical protein
MAAIASMTDDGARAASTVANHKRGYAKWVQFAGVSGFDPTVTAQAATPTGPDAWRFTELTDRLCAFVLWLWTSPKDRGKGFRTSDSVTQLVTGLAMTIKRKTGFHVMHLHGLYKLRLEGMNRLETKWGKTVCRARPLRMQELLPCLPGLPSRNALHDIQLPLALRVGITFCLRVGELTRQRKQKHFIRKSGVRPVVNDDGKVCGVSLELLTSKGVWRKSGQRTRTITIDPSRISKCCLCAKWMLLPRQPTLAVHRCGPCGGPTPPVIGSDTHAVAALDLLQFVTDFPPTQSKEPLFPALGYDAVKEGLAFVASRLGVDRRALTPHCLRRGGTCDKIGIIKPDGSRAFTSANLRVFARWSSKIWEIIYAESKLSVLEHP